VVSTPVLTQAPVVLTHEQLIKSVMLTIWEAAVPPCVAAIVACIVYLTTAHTNFWDVFFQLILGHLYVISMFVIRAFGSEVFQPKEVTLIVRRCSVGITIAFLLF
jgi:hypothetical protein